MVGRRPLPIRARQAVASPAMPTSASISPSASRPVSVLTAVCSWWPSSGLRPIVWAASQSCGGTSVYLGNRLSLQIVDLTHAPCPAVCAALRDRTPNSSDLAEAAESVATTVAIRERRQPAREGGAHASG